MCDYYFFFLYKGFNMTSWSSSNHYDVTSESLEDDLPWKQKNHISQHIWNGANERMLKIRRATLVYNHTEAVSDKIIPLLQVLGLYPIMKLAQLKVSGALVNAFIERLSQKHIHFIWSVRRQLLHFKMFLYYLIFLWM